MSGKPIVTERRVVKIGRSFYISLPPEWLETIGKEIETLLVIADKDIRIVNPEHRDEVYEEVSKIVREAKI